MFTNFESELDKKIQRKHTYSNGFPGLFLYLCWPHDKQKHNIGTYIWIKNKYRSRGQMATRAAASSKQPYAASSSNQHLCQTSHCQGFSGTLPSAWVSTSVSYHDATSQMFHYFFRFFKFWTSKHKMLLHFPWGPSFKLANMRCCFIFFRFFKCVSLQQLLDTCAILPHRTVCILYERPRVAREITNMQK